jgi:hypothetical protein
VIDPIASGAADPGSAAASILSRGSGVKIALVATALVPLGYGALAWRPAQEPAALSSVSVQTEPGSADRQPSTGDRGTARARARSATTSPSTSEPRPSAPAAKQRLAAVTVGDASYIEAESGELQGFTITSDATASGGAHVEAESGRVDSSPNAGPRAAYDFSVERSGRYVTWVRLRGPHVQADSFFARMDGGPWFETSLTTGDAFHWVAIHDFDLAQRRRDPMVVTLEAGRHRLEIHNREGGTMIDRFYVTALGDVPGVKDDNGCRPTHTVLLAGACVPSCGHARHHLRQAPPDGSAWLPRHRGYVPLARARCHSAAAGDRSRPIARQRATGETRALSHQGRCCSRDR